MYYSNPEDTGVQQTSKAMVEVQARKYILAMTTTIIQRANEILALARERVEEMRSIEILGNATFVTTLLPLVIAHIGPLASSDPRVSLKNDYSFLLNWLIFFVTQVFYKKKTNWTLLKSFSKYKIKVLTKKMIFFSCFFFGFTFKNCLLLICKMFILKIYFLNVCYAF